MMRAAVGTVIVLLTFAAAAPPQTPAGGEFRVNTFTTNRQWRALPAMEPDGDFVVVWMSASQDGSSYGAFGQRFAASGTPRGSEFQINTFTTGYQAKPDVAVGRRGDFVVVWETFQDGSGKSIQGRRYDALGNAIGGEFRVNSYTTDHQYRPHVGRAADGGFVVSWTTRFGGAGYRTPARRFDPSGNPIGGDLVVNTWTGSQAFGDLAVGPNGTFVAVWQDESNRDGSGYGIFGQRFDGSGNRLGSDFQVNTYTTGHQSVPSVSVSPAGGFVVVWNSRFGDGSGYAAFARSFDAAGNAVGNDFVVNTYTTGDQGGLFGQVAHDERGNFVVTWHSQGDGDSYGSFAQRFSASGARRGATFQVNAYTAAYQAWPSVASDSVGNFVVVWASIGQDGSYQGVFAQRFGGLGPASLTVDAPGNQVLEPGETVEVSPTWRNFNGAAQTFSGTLTDIAGPAGPTYTITDPAGNYGTVANGANGPCTDCYAVSVSNPTTRPTIHWDASAVESIVPDTQGQQKQWLLHVGDSFLDVPRASGFYRFVETLLHHDVTGGCTSSTFCPSASTTREQAAVFVLIAKDGAGNVPPACNIPMFADVPASSPFCPWIEELVRRGVVGGCGGGNYCPAAPVSREQMAVFVLLTKEPGVTPPACGTPMFNDVPASSPFCRWIEELARRGVVTGCGGGNYCPTAAVTREQMAVFLSVTFGLMLYGP